MEKTHQSPAVGPTTWSPVAYCISPRSLTYLSRVASVVSFGIALICLSAWLADYPPVHVAMYPLTVLGVILASAAVWFSSCSAAGSNSLWLRRFFSYLLIGLALSKLVPMQFHFPP